MLIEYSIFLIVLFTTSCAPKIPPKIEFIPRLELPENNENNFKNKDYWYNEKYIDENTKLYDIKSSKKISLVKKEYSIKDGILYFKNKKVDSLRIFYQQNENTEIIVDIVNGKPLEYIIEANNNPLPTMYRVTYFENGDINYHFIEREVFLPKGSRIFKNYYYSRWNSKIQKFSTEILKEEGKIENNFKIGEWKYYNPNGTLDSLKTYTLEDSVDVRFLHCLFNKNEPCH